MPALGDRRDVSCSWCGRPVVEVFTRYPASAGITGGYWDCSACSCGGSLKWYAAFGAKFIEQHQRGKARRPPI